MQIKQCIFFKQIRIISIIKNIAFACAILLICNTQANQATKATTQTKSQVKKTPPKQKPKSTTNKKQPSKAKPKSTQNTKSTKARQKPKYTPKPPPNPSELNTIISKAKVLNYGELNSPHLAKLKRALDGKNELKILVFGDSHIAGDTLTHQWRKTIMQPNSVGFIYPVFPTFHQNLLVKTVARDFDVKNSRIDAYDDYPFGGVIARAKKENAQVKITLKFAPEHQDFLFRAIFKTPSSTQSAFIIKDSSGQTYKLNAKETNVWEISQDFALRFPIEIKSLLPNATLGGYFIYQDSKSIGEISQSSKVQLNKLKKIPPNASNISMNDTNETIPQESQSSQDSNDIAQLTTQANQNLQKFSYATLTNLPKNSNNLIAHIGANGARSDIWRKWNQQVFTTSLCAFKYDFIVLVYGSNDALVMPLDTKVFEANYSELITAIRKCNEGATILLVGPPKVITKPRKAKNYRIAPYFVAVRESVRKVAKKEGTLYFDMHEFIEDSGGKDAWVTKGLSKKDVHLTPFGYSIIADGIAYGLDKLLNNTKVKEPNEPSHATQEPQDTQDSPKSSQKSHKNSQENPPQMPPESPYNLKTPDINSAPEEIWQTQTQ